MKSLLEIAVFNIDSAMLAIESGCDRIELCDNASEGGTTASYGTLKLVREKISTSVYPIIRPRGGDFVYSDLEYEVMIKDVQLCKELGFEGLVTGILMPSGKVDKSRCARLVDIAYPMSVTFHRAFDMSVDPFEAMEDIIEVGCERILTSGQRPVAEANLPLIKELIEQAKDRIIIMPGSGVRSNNIKEIAQQTGAVEFHSSARTLKQSVTTYLNKEMHETYKQVSVDTAEIIKMKEQLKTLDLV